MDIHEYQAKEILARFGVPVPRGGLAYSPEQAGYRAREIGGHAWVVKAQIHSGGRGEAGGVKLCRSEDEVRGSLGIAPGAYDRPGKTDGVDFAIEFLGADGRRERLYHRYLNPADETDDRGTPAFAITLPENPRGRLLLRSFNPHYRNAAWDWAFWRDVVIE